MSPASIAKEIQGRRNQIIEDWSRSVRLDPRIKSDEGLSAPELIDHVPAIVEEICELIGKSEIPGVRNTIESRANVYTRLHQGYSGRDLVRELSLLRITLLEHLWEIPSDEPVSAKERQGAAIIINLYLDEEMRYAISVFCDRSTDSAPERPSN